MPLFKTPPRIHTLETSFDHCETKDDRENVIKKEIGAHLKVHPLRIKLVDPKEYDETAHVEYAVVIDPPFWKLREWIDIEMINYPELSSNPNAIALLTANPEMIHWANLSGNPNAIKLLEENKENICWRSLSGNPNDTVIRWLEDNPYLVSEYEICLNRNDDAIKLMEKITKWNGLTGFSDDIRWHFLSVNPHAIRIMEWYYDYINWDSLCLNTHDKAIQMLEENPKMIYWPYLSKNPNKNAVRLLMANPHKIDWKYLSKNPNDDAVRMLIANPEKIDWENFSKNTHPDAIRLLEANLDKVHWYNLSMNPSAIKILEANQDKINWGVFSCNPAIFEWIK